MQDFVNYLPNLMGITLESCNLQSIETLCNAKKLRSLHVPKNHITELPSNLSNLSDTLQYLEIKSNPIKELPLQIVTCTKLISIDMNNTLVSELPQDIGQLSQLRFLDIGHTLIHTLPHSFRMLKVSHRA